MARSPKVCELEAIVRAQSEIIDLQDQIRVKEVLLSPNSPIRSPDVNLKPSSLSRMVEGSLSFDSISPIHARGSDDQIGRLEMENSDLREKIGRLEMHISLIGDHKTTEADLTQTLETRASEAEKKCERHKDLLNAAKSKLKKALSKIHKITRNLETRTSEAQQLQEDLQAERDHSAKLASELKKIKNGNDTALEQLADLADQANLENARLRDRLELAEKENEDLLQKLSEHEDNYQSEISVKNNRIQNLEATLNSSYFEQTPIVPTKTRVIHDNEMLVLHTSLQAIRVHMESRLHDLRKFQRFKNDMLEIVKDGSEEKRGVKKDIKLIDSLVVKDAEFLHYIEQNREEVDNAIVRCFRQGNEMFFKQRAMNCWKNRMGQRNKARKLISHLMHSRELHLMSIVIRQLQRNAKYMREKEKQDCIDKMTQSIACKYIAKMLRSSLSKCFRHWRLRTLKQPTKFITISQCPRSQAVFYNWRMLYLRRQQLKSTVISHALQQDTFWQGKLSLAIHKLHLHTISCKNRDADRKRVLRHMVMSLWQHRQMLAFEKLRRLPPPPKTPPKSIKKARDYAIQKMCRQENLFKLFFHWHGAYQKRKRMKDTLRTATRHRLEHLVHFAFQKLTENAYNAKISSLADSHKKTVKDLKDDFELCLSAEKVQNIQSAKKMKRVFRMQGVSEHNNSILLDRFHHWRYFVKDEKRKRSALRSALSRMRHKIIYHFWIRLYSAKYKEVNQIHHHEQEVQIAMADRFRIFKLKAVAFASWMHEHAQVQSEKKGHVLHRVMFHMRSCALSRAFHQWRITCLQRHGQSDIHAVECRHQSDMQEVESRHQSDMQAVECRHQSDMQAVECRYQSDMQAIECKYQSDRNRRLTHIIFSRLLQTQRMNVYIAFHRLSNHSYTISNCALRAQVVTLDKTRLRMADIFGKMHVQDLVRKTQSAVLHAWSDVAKKSRMQRTILRHMIHHTWEKDVIHAFRRLKDHATICSGREDKLRHILLRAVHGRELMAFRALFRFAMNEKMKIQMSKDAKKNQDLKRKIAGRMFRACCDRLVTMRFHQWRLITQASKRRNDAMMHYVLKRASSRTNQRLHSAFALLKRNAVTQERFILHKKSKLALVMQALTHAVEARTVATFHHWRAVTSMGRHKKHQLDMVIRAQAERILRVGWDIYQLRSRECVTAKNRAFMQRVLESKNKELLIQQKKTKIAQTFARIDASNQILVTMTFERWKSTTQISTSRKRFILIKLEELGISYLRFGFNQWKYSIESQRIGIEEKMMRAWQEVTRERGRKRRFLLDCFSGRVSLLLRSGFHHLQTQALKIKACEEAAKERLLHEHALIVSEASKSADLKVHVAFMQWQRFVAHKKRMKSVVQSMIRRHEAPCPREALLTWRLYASNARVKELQDRFESSDAAKARRFQCRRLWDIWRTKLKQIQTLKKASTRLNCRMKREAWSKLKGHVQLKVLQSSLSEQEQKMNKKLEILKKKEIIAIMQGESNLDKVRVFKFWVSLVRRKHILRKYISRGLKSSLSQGFNKLRLHRREQENQELNQMCVRGWFNHWRCVYSLQKRHKRLLSSLFARMAYRRKQDALRRFRENIHHHKIRDIEAIKRDRDKAVRDKILRRIVPSAMKRLFQGSFNKLHAHAKERSKQLDMLRNILLSRQIRELRKGWRILMTHTQMKRCATLIKESDNQHKEMKLLKQKCLQNSKRAFGFLVRHRRENLSVSVFFHWRRWLHGKKRGRRIVKKVLSRSVSIQLQKAFNQLKLQNAHCALEEKQNLCDKMCRALEDFENELSTRSEQLQTHLDEKANLQHALEYQTERFAELEDGHGNVFRKVLQCRSLARSFKGWHAVFILELRKRRLVRMMLTNLTNRNLRDVFKFWRHSAQTLRSVDNFKLISNKTTEIDKLQKALREALEELNDIKESESEYKAKCEAMNTRVDSLKNLLDQRSDQLKFLVDENSKLLKQKIENTTLRRKLTENQFLESLPPVNKSNIFTSTQVEKHGGFREMISADDSELDNSLLAFEEEVVEKHKSEWPSVDEFFR